MITRQQEASYIKNKRILETVGLTDEEYKTGEWKKVVEFLKMPQEHIERYVKEKKQTDILYNPHMFNLITETEFDKKIVGEIQARKTIFLCAMGGCLVENCQVASYNLLINDSAGTGKDYVTSNVLSVIPNERYVKKTRISPATFTYWHNSAYEPEWTWDGKVFYCEDIGEGVLNSEVFKVMCSSGSDATVIIKQKAVDLKIEGKPVMIITTANSIPNPELTRRFEMVNLTESVSQTEDVMKRHSMNAIEGHSPNYNGSLKESLSMLERVKVKIPYAEKLYLIFPATSVMMRTKFPRFLDLIKASAAIHQFQRQKDENGYLIAEKKDYEIAIEAMKFLTTNKYMISLTKNKKWIMDFIYKKTEEDNNYKANASEIRVQMKSFISLKAMKTNLSQLCSYGLLQTTIGEDTYGREIELYEVCKHNLDLNKRLNFPNFEAIKHL